MRFLTPLTLCTALIFAGCTTSKPLNIKSLKTDWQLQNNTTISVDAAGCLLQSPPKRFATGAGIGEVSIVISDQGLVSLRTKRDRFDTRAIGQIGISVDNGKPVLAPQTVSAHELRFSRQQSDTLLEGMAAGKTAKVQVALHPRKELLTDVFSLDEFEKMLLNYRMCEVMNKQRQASFGE